MARQNRRHQISSHPALEGHKCRNTLYPIQHSHLGSRTMRINKPAMGQVSKDEKLPGTERVKRGEWDAKRKNMGIRGEEREHTQPVLILVRYNHGRKLD